ncbi:MAG: GNAT family N-acetyltransferase [Rhodobacteraceae bacterium]|nr:GNAT family N-acetyltransferase [Paracoccaceae bacterium]
MIRLEPFTADDIGRLIEWIPDATALLQWAGPTLSWPLTPEQLARDVAALRPDGPYMMFKAIDEAGEVVGHIEIKSIDRTHANAMLGRILVAPLARGRGLSAPITRAALAVCFDQLKLHRVGLRVFAHNTAAIKSYRRVGFQIEGNERDTKRAPDGTWWNACTMAILENDWRAHAAG